MPSVKTSGNIFFALIVAAFAVSAFMRNAVWSDDAALWRSAVSRSYSKWRPHYMLGADMLKGRRMPYAAIGEFEKALKLKPDEHIILGNMGLALIYSGRDEAGVAVLLEAVEKNPGLTSAQVNLGAFYLEKGRYAESAAWFEKALEIKPSDEAALVNIGFAYGALGRYRDAILAEEAALSANPRQYNAHYALAMVYERTGNVKDAALHWQSYLNLAPAKDPWRGDAERRLRAAGYAAGEGHGR